MEEYIMTIMKRASIFMILAQALIQFRPNPSYEKYLKFLAGIMTVVILVIPVMELFHRDIAEQYEAYMDQYMERLQEASGQELSIAATPSQTYFYTLEEKIKTKLNNYASENGYCVESAEIWGISENGKMQEEDGYKIKLRLLPEKREISTVKVDKIKLQGENPDAEKIPADTAEEAALRKEMSDLLGIEEDKVEVEIVE